MTFPAYKVPDDAIVDVGIIAVGGIVAAWAATVDGLEWDPGKKVRHPEWDGRTFEYEGMHRTVMYDGKLSGKIKRGGAALMMDLEPGATSDGASGSDGNTITLLAARTPWTVGMYLSDVFYMALQQDGTVFRVDMLRAMVESYKLKTKDNDEGTWDIVIKPVSTTIVSAPNAVPFTYHYVAAA